MWTSFTSVSIPELQSLRTYLVMLTFGLGALTILAGMGILRVENRIIELQRARDADRDVTASQLETLKAVLAPIAGQKMTISAVPNNSEAEQFATRLRNAMNRSGMQASPSGDRPAWSQTPKGFGLIVGVTRDKDAAVLREALSKAGLATEHIQHQTSGDSMGLELFIGLKN
jgi:hypothetical protein